MHFVRDLFNRLYFICTCRSFFHVFSATFGLECSSMYKRWTISLVLISWIYEWSVWAHCDDPSPTEPLAKLALLVLVECSLVWAFLFIRVNYWSAWGYVVTVSRHSVPQRWTGTHVGAGSELRLVTTMRFYFYIYLCNLPCVCFYCIVRKKVYTCTSWINIIIINNKNILC